MAVDPDPLIEEIVRARRDRLVLVIAAVIGIVVGAVLGMGFTLGAFGSAVDGARHPRSPAALLFFVAPLAVTMPVGYLVYLAIRRRRG